MQVVFDKHEKKKLVIKLHRQGRTIREIAHTVRISFSDIGKIIRMINDQNNNDGIDLKDKSIETRATYLFSIGKTPLEIAIELNLPAT